jgi:hypothetical protein
VHFGCEGLVAKALKTEVASSVDQLSQAVLVEDLTRSYDMGHNACCWQMRYATWH